MSTRIRKKIKRTSNKELRLLELEEKRSEHERLDEALDTVQEISEALDAEEKQEEPEEELSPEMQQELERLSELRRQLEERAVKRAERMAGKSRREVAITFIGDPDAVPGGESRLGITRPNKSKSKSALKMAKNSRRKNRRK